MVAAAGAIAVLLLRIDARLGPEQFGPLQPLLYTGGTQATRGLLSTIGSAMLTVAGTTVVYPDVTDPARSLAVAVM